MSCENHCYWTDFPLKIISNKRIFLIAKIHSIKEVYTREPGCFFWIERRLKLFTTSLFTSQPFIIPDSFILYWFSGLIAAISEIARRENHDLIIRIVTLFTRTESIFWAFLVRKIRLCYKKSYSQRFPSFFKFFLITTVEPRYKNIIGNHLCILIKKVFLYKENLLF